jgi:hypothetical protein
LGNCAVPSKHTLFDAISGSHVSHKMVTLCGSFGFARATITAERHRAGSLCPAGSGPNGHQAVRIVFVLPHRRRSGDTLVRLPILLLLLVGCILVDWRGHSVSAQDACRAMCGGSSGQSCAQGNFSACTVNCNSTAGSSSTSTSTTTMDNTCLGATFADASVVTCNGDGVCDNAQFLDQTVANCVGDATCHQVAVWSSTLRCNGASSCQEAHVYAGTVSCSDYTTCESIAYNPCSCCQMDSTAYSSYCPYEMPLCTNSVLDFCAATYLGRTCAEWNNPVCAGLTIGECEIQGAKVCFSLAGKKEYCYLYR